MAGFSWFNPQAISSPEQAARQRSVAEALINRSATPGTNWAEGLSDLTSAITGTVLSDRVSSAEEEGRRSAAAALAGLGPNSDFSSVSAALANPWLSGPQSQVASALLSQNLERQDPLYQLQLKQAEMEYNKALNPGPQLYDPNAPSSFQEWQLSQAFPGYTPDDGSLVTVNTGDNSGAFTKKADELAATRFDGMISEGTAAQQMMGDINTLAALGSQINTGKTAEVMNTLGPYASALGIPIEGLGEGQAYKAIVDRMAPQMRPAGSGSSSDTDVKMFLNSLPQLGNSPEGNQIITETISAVQQQKMAAAQIASDAMSGLKTWQQADTEIRALGNPYERFNEYRKRSGVQVDNGKVIQAPNGITIRKIGD